MPIDDDIVAFKKWASKMGLPLHCMPTDESLRCVLKSPQGEMLRHDMMRKIRPKADVLKMRQNSLLAKAKELNMPMNNSFIASSYPKYVQTFCEVRNLNEIKKQLTLKTTESKSRCENLLSSIRNKNSCRLQLKRKLELITDKAAILELKAESLTKSIENEESMNMQLKHLIPQKFKPNSNQLNLVNPVELAEKRLMEYQLDGAEHILWTDLKNIFADTSNWEIWNEILKANGNLLQKLITLTKTEGYFNTQSDPERFSTLETEILKLRTFILSIIFKCDSRMKETNELSQKFIPAHEKFVNAFQLQMVSFNADNTNFDELIANYVEQTSRHFFLLEKINSLKSEINSLNIRVQSNSQSLQIHPVLLNTTRKIYEEVALLINRLVLDTSNLGEVKRKITHNKKVLQHMLNTARNQTRTGDLTDSFEISNILCSTKMDLENSFMNTTRIETNVMNIKTNQFHSVVELMNFADLPLECLDYSYRNCAFYMHPNFKLNENGSPSLLQTTPSHLYNSYGLLEQIKARLKWTQEIQKYSISRNIPLTICEVDENNLKQLRQYKIEEIAEIIDKIKSIAIRSMWKFQKLRKLYEFVLENCLRQFIPSTVLFNGRSYVEYESELLTYSRMIGNDSSLNDTYNHAGQSQEK